MFDFPEGIFTSIMRGWMCVNFSGKKRYVTLECPEEDLRDQI